MSRASGSLRTSFTHDRTEARSLPRPAVYLPFAHGRYDVVPGLTRLGKDFGNGRADERVFQLDAEFAHYRAEKLRRRRELLSRYVAVAKANQAEREIVDEVLRHMAVRLAVEYPGLFDVSDRLRCKLTRETIELTSGKVAESSSRVKPGYVSLLDAIACQVQEDLAVVRVDRVTGRDWIAAIHLCFPNHWAAEEKAGTSFAAAHAPVAGIEPIAARAGEYARMMVDTKHELVRFAWGVATDTRLAHHPADPTPGRRFDPAKPAAFVRVERQTITGFPALSAALFTIRTSFVDVTTLSADHRHALAASVRSMSPESLAYKGLAPWRDDLLAWLSAESRQ
jgi:hypothetical protein